MIRIPIFQTLSFSQIIKALFAPLKDVSNSNILYTYRGSCAIYNAIKTINMKNEEHVLMPAYQCGLETEMVLQAKRQVKYYKINFNLTIDLNDIKRKIDQNTRVIFIIHYFGFIQDLRELRKICDEKNIILFEDCAHVMESLLNSHRKIYSDIRIYSFKKTMPVVDGGALVMDKRFRMPNINTKYDKIWILREVILCLYNNIKFTKPRLSSMIKAIIITPSIYIYRLIKWHIQKESVSKLKKKEGHFFVNISNFRMSKFSLKIMQTIKLKEAQIERRKNFEYLLKHLSKFKEFKPIFNHLPVTMIPLYFPIISKNRDILMKELSKSGIKTCMFGNNLHPLVPRDDFTVAKELSDSNFCLSVHQGLTIDHMKYIIRVLEEISGQVSMETTEC